MRTRRNTDCTSAKSSRADSSCFHAPSGRRWPPEEAVKAYIQDWRDHAAQELDFFKSRKTLAEAIEVAAHAKAIDPQSKRPNGRRHSHQRRIPGAVLAMAEIELQKAAFRLRKCRSFSELHDCINEKIGAIRGIGKLAVYDIATRIGAYLQLQPELVGFHSLVELLAQHEISQQVKDRALRDAVSAKRLDLGGL